MTDPPQDPVILTNVDNHQVSDQSLQDKVTLP